MVNRNIKLVISDVDGVLTDGGMYYTESGDEFKKFNTRDGMGFQLLREAGIKTAIITSEQTEIVNRRAKKLKVDYLYQGKQHGGKLNAALEICLILEIGLSNVVYIGDDINCYELLTKVGFPFCPNDSAKMILEIPQIRILSKNGGFGVFREMVDIILNKN